ncbi:CZB domain-containing protein [Thiobacillus sp.]|uniref:CZB domain-containing protein n=1 Tax=Thiobacillus sp. TaxID=924 RepID=UPI0025E71C1F|nr:CZB domain-containing protein [Thiobacillus sp.]MBT9540886.1 CZB domain-containing protein [Thiobacillus sp.]
MAAKQDFLPILSARSFRFHNVAQRFCLQIEHRDSTDALVLDQTPYFSASKPARYPDGKTRFLYPDKFSAKKNCGHAVIDFRVYSFIGAGMTIKSDIEEAIAVHGAWKATFRNFLSGKVELDLSSVGRADACKLGIWLNDGGRRKLSPENYAKACEMHDRFHQVAGEIVHNIKQKNFEAARQSLASGGDFDRASHAVCAFLRKLTLHDNHKPATPTHDAAATPEATTQATEKRD